MSAVPLYFRRPHHIWQSRPVDKIFTTESVTNSHSELSNARVWRTLLLLQSSGIEGESSIDVASFAHVYMSSTRGPVLVIFISGFFCKFVPTEVSKFPNSEDPIQ